MAEVSKVKGKVNSDNKLKAIGYKRNRAKIENAFALYQKDHEAGISGLLEAVIEFAQGKMFHSMSGENEAFVTPDDFAQEVAIYVWGFLPRFVGEPDAFYSWLNKVSFSATLRGHNEINSEHEGKIPLLVESVEDLGIMDDNPVLYPNTRPTFQRELPDFIQGVDRRICGYIREGFSYKEISEVIEQTESFVTTRVRRMREAVEKSKSSTSTKEKKVTYA